MDRVAVFKTFVVLLILVFWDAPNSRVEAASKPPNILMIFSDDVTKLDLGSYGEFSRPHPKNRSTRPGGGDFQSCFHHFTFLFSQSRLTLHRALSLPPRRTPQPQLGGTRHAESSSLSESPRLSRDPAG